MKKLAVIIVIIALISGYFWLNSSSQNKNVKHTQHFLEVQASLIEQAKIQKYYEDKGLFKTPDEVNQFTNELNSKNVMMDKTRMTPEEWKTISAEVYELKKRWGDLIDASKINFR